MRVDVVTIFPDQFPGPLGESVIGRARQRGLLDLVVHDLRDWSEPPHHQVDDEPFGGGGGMVLKPEPLFEALEDVGRRVSEAGMDPGPVILLTPQGERLEQRRVADLARRSQMTLVCGRYEGVDQRVRERLVDFELSIGDYVLSGGELPAMLVVDAVTRLQPGALGDENGAQRDSFSEALLDYPQYTRPAEYRGRGVPEVLRSGNHEAIARWRRGQALLRTTLRRPELIATQRLAAEDEKILVEALERRAALESRRAKTRQDDEIDGPPRRSERSRAGTE